MSGNGTSPLTVGYVLKMFPRFCETFVLNEILELERRGVRVVVFSMKVADEALRQPDLERLRAPVTTIPPLRGRGLWQHLAAHVACLARSPGRYRETVAFVRGRRSATAWRKFLVAPFIVQRARAQGIEHLHAHFASGPARQAKFVSLLSGLPFSFTAHAKDLYWEGHNHGKNNKLKKRLRSASFVVVISDFNHRFLRSLNFSVPRRRVLTLYNGIDLERWPLRLPAGRPTPAAAIPLLLAVGRLVPKKGFDVLLHACRILKDEGRVFRCLIAGDGPERLRLQQLRDELGLETDVELPGSVPQDRLREELMPRAHVLIQPSVVASNGDQDGIPTVVLEALALGLPVVATPVSGIPEAVADGESGLLVPQNSGQATAAAVARILDDADLAAQLARGGRARVERSFDLRLSVSVLHHLFLNAARGNVRWSETKMRALIGLGPRPDADNREVVVENQS